MTRRGLGRLYQPDARDKKFLLKKLLPDKPRPKTKQWACNWSGDQKDTPQCVGFAWHALLRSKPVLQRKPVAATIYQEAQKVDEWEGEDYEGTSVRGGAKALQEAGKIQAYGWAFDLETILQWLGTKGPVVLGTDWYETMFDPDSAGRVHIGGEVAGGHAYLCIGYDEKREALLCQNSWGKSWGKNGRFWIPYVDALVLIHDQGEACTPTEPNP